MTRFARARGSKASNQRVPQPATDWSEMKQQLLETNSKRKGGDNDADAEEFKKMRLQNYQKFLDEEIDSKTTPEWAEFEVKQDNNQIKQETDDDDEAPVEVSAKQPIENPIKPIVKKAKSKKIADIKPQEKNKVLKMVKKETKLMERKKQRQQKQLLKKKAEIDGDSKEIVDESEKLKKTKKDPSELTEKELELIERKQKKRLAQLAKKKLKKQQNLDNNYDNSSNNNTVDKSQKVKKSRRKPAEETQIINGRPVAVMYMDGFPIKKDDYERLTQLKKDLLAKNIPKEEVDHVMKLERRKAEKSLTRERKNVCYKCRKSGHNLSECPELNSESAGSGICFKCGSTEHKHFQCRVVRNDDYRYASCFVCGEEGHISRQCKSNDRGIYPKGGSCMVCGSNEHLKRDCPQFKQEQQPATGDDAVFVRTLNDHDNPEIDEVGGVVETKKKVKHIKF